MKPTVVDMVNTDPWFYPLMREHLGTGPIAVELDTEVYDRPAHHKRWWIALGRPWWRLWRPTVLGFCAAADGVLSDNVLKFENFWVHPRARGRGIGRQLFEARLAACQGRAIRGWASDASLPLYLEHGFAHLDKGVSNGLTWHLVEYGT